MGTSILRFEPPMLLADPCSALMLLADPCSANIDRMGPARLPGDSGWKSGFGVPLVLDRVGDGGTRDGFGGDRIGL